MRRNVRLDYARLTEGQEPLKPTFVDASDLLAGLVRAIKPIALEKGLKVTAKGPKRLLVESDAPNLNWVGHNLLLAIINHTTQGQLHLRWDADPSKMSGGLVWRLPHPMSDYFSSC